MTDSERHALTVDRLHANHSSARDLSAPGLSAPELAAASAVGQIASTAAFPLAPELTPPVVVLEPLAGSVSPLVLSSPHSGAVYPARFLAASRLSASALRKSEDAFVDDLFAGALAHGAPMLKALFPRAYVDVNREPYELDPRMFGGALPSFVNTGSIRVAGGLGTIPRSVGEGQDIYSAALDVDEAMARIEGLYKPYHRMLRELLARARKAHGLAVLMDCHSMPSASSALSGSDKSRADVVIGDRYGTSCDSVYVECVEETLRGLGYKVVRNKPYAGGYITEYFGAASQSCEALQIEINRGLYMDERTLTKKPAFHLVAQDMALVTGALAALANAQAREMRLGRAGERTAAE
jgi:N-formylglutamate amidohydrolase